MPKDLFLHKKKLNKHIYSINIYFLKYILVYSFQVIKNIVKSKEMMQNSNFSMKFDLTSIFMLFFFF